MIAGAFPANNDKIGSYCSKVRDKRKINSQKVLGICRNGDVIREDVELDTFFPVKLRKHLPYAAPLPCAR